MSDVVVLVNERPESRAALNWVIDHAADATVHLVLGPSTDIPGGPEYVSPSLIEEVTAQLRESSVHHRIHCAASDPAHHTVELAEEVNAALVVIGMPRRSATLKLIIGSYTRDILADAPCPVVIVKDRPAVRR
ncbi:hypothetical protein B1R94_19515 [Mycolicibacterium litorale]|nr:hypothetical protein B1R94_19515 [Mycolicibacterium litorale]